MKRKEKKKKKKQDTRRRDLSGIYIFDTLPQDKRHKPTCLEDCTEARRIEWLSSLTTEAQRDTARHLNECFGKVWDMLRPEEQRTLDETCSGKPYCDVFNDSELNVREINRFCKLLRLLADMAGICAKGSEADPDYIKDEDE